MQTPGQSIRRFGVSATILMRPILMPNPRDQRLDWATFPAVRQGAGAFRITTLEPARIRRMVKLRESPPSKADQDQWRPWDPVDKLGRWDLADRQDRLDQWDQSRVVESAEGRRVATMAQQMVRWVLARAPDQEHTAPVHTARATLVPATDQTMPVRVMVQGLPVQDMVVRAMGARHPLRILPLPMDQRVTDQSLRPCRDRCLAILTSITSVRASTDSRKPDIIASPITAIADPGISPVTRATTATPMFRGSQRLDSKVSIQQPVDGTVFQRLAVCLRYHGNRDYSLFP